jgi:hypothetical protein
LPASNAGQSIPSCLFEAGGKPLDRVHGRRFLSRRPRYYAIDGGQSARCGHLAREALNGKPQSDRALPPRRSRPTLTDWAQRTDARSPFQAFGVRIPSPVHPGCRLDF